MTVKRRAALLAAAVLGVAATASGVIAAQQGSPGGELATVGSSRTTLEADPILSQARWLRSAGGAETPVTEAPRLPSLEFPPGTNYAEALTSIYESVVEQSALPSNARQVVALPPGVVLRQPAGDEGIQVSLVAPWGYRDTATPERQAIYWPSVHFTKFLDPEVLKQRVIAAEAAGRAIPEGAAVDVPDLPDCQIMRGDVAPPPCGDTP